MLCDKPLCGIWVDAGEKLLVSTATDLSAAVSILHVHRTVAELR